MGNTPRVRSKLRVARRAAIVLVVFACASAAGAAGVLGMTHGALEPRSLAWLGVLVLVGAWLLVDCLWS